MNTQLGLSVEQEERLAVIQARRRRRVLRNRRVTVPSWASVEDVEEFVRLVSDRTKTVYIFELDGGEGYEWTMWDPTDQPHEGTLVKTVTLEPEPRR